MIINEVEGKAIMAIVLQMAADMNEIKRVMVEFISKVPSKQDNTDNPFYTEKEIMSIFKITSQKYWTTFTRSNKIPHYRVGDARVYRKNDIDIFLSKHKA